MKRHLILPVLLLASLTYAQEPLYQLTVQTDPYLIGTTTPSIGEHFVSGTVELEARDFVYCPDIYRFVYWIGEVADPNAAQTTITMDADKAVRAVYALAEPRCGDKCHPNFTTGDLNHDCIVDLGDFSMLISRWMNCTHPDCDSPDDFRSPLPNPAQWQGEPFQCSSTSICMEAVPATDSSGVEYRFVCFEDDTLTSEWMQNVDQNGTGYTQTPWAYEVSGLESGTYTFFVKTRDRSPTLNETTPSVAVSVIIVVVDGQPPLPNPAQHQTGYPVAIYDGGQWYHIVKAVQAADDSGVEYRFVCSENALSSGGSLGNGPQWRNVDNLAGLFYPNPSSSSTFQVPYEYHVRTYTKHWDYTWYIITRDRSVNQNTGLPSISKAIVNP